MGDTEYFEQIWNILEEKINLTWVKECFLWMTFCNVRVRRWLILRNQV